MKNRAPAALAAGIVAVSIISGCGARSGAAGATGPPTVLTAPGTYSAPVETARTTKTPEAPKPAGDRTATFRVKDTEGYAAVLKLTFHDLVTYASKAEAEPTLFSCLPWPQTGKVRALGLQVDAEVTPETVSGISWPQGRTIGAAVYTRQPGGYDPMNRICDGEKYSGPNAAPGNPATGWVFFVSSVTPKHPLGWDKPMPWAEVHFEVNGGGVESCKVLTKDKSIALDPDPGPHACAGTFPGR